MQKAHERIYISKSALLIILVVILSLGLGVFFTFAYSKKGPKLLPAQVETQPMRILPVEKLMGGALQEIIMKDTGEKKLTLFIIADGYSDSVEALSHIDTLKQSLTFVEPFQNMQENLEITPFFTDSTQCIISGSEKKRLTCGQELFEKVKNIGRSHYKVVVLSPQEFISGSDFSRGKNSVITISTHKGNLTVSQLAGWIGTLFMQELGHSLGLAYEYDGKNADSYPEKIFSDTPNCVTSLEAAQSVWGNHQSDSSAIGFFQGCGGSSKYVYPEKGTLMSNLPEKESYGVVSENYLRGVLSCFYAQKETYGGSNLNCKEFTDMYPNFWKE